jgi:hypothetical protein
MAKTQVYSWRVSAVVKERLERQARREHRSVASLLDDIITGRLLGEEPDDDEQQRLHRAALRFAGIIRGTDPTRSRRVRRIVRDRLERRRGR